jgi:hypothetical protein
VRRWLLPVTWLLFFTAFAACLVFWGGIARVPAFGEQVERAAARHAFLTATYMGVGKHVVPLLGEERAAQWARGQLASHWDEIASAPPGLLVERIIVAMPVWLRAAHHGAPLLLLLGLVLHLFRPRPVKIIGGRR